MGKARKVVHQFRKWLNPLTSGEGNAFIAGRISVIPPTDQDRKYNFEHYTPVEANLDIADCTRQVTLEFSVWGKQDLARVRKKIDLFEYEINVFATMLRSALDEAEELMGD